MQKKMKRSFDVPRNLGMSLIKAFKASNQDGVALISPSHHNFGRNFIFCIIWLGYVILYFSFEAEAEAESEFMWLRQLHTRRVHDQKAPATRRKNSKQMERQIQLFSAMKKSERTSDSKKLYNFRARNCVKNHYFHSEMIPPTVLVAHTLGTRKVDFPFALANPVHMQHTTHIKLFLIQNSYFSRYPLSLLDMMKYFLAQVGAEHTKKIKIFSSDFGSWLISQSPLDTAHTPGFGQHQLALPMRNFVAEKDLPDHFLSFFLFLSLK